MVAARNGRQLDTNTVLSHTRSLRLTSVEQSDNPAERKQPQRLSSRDRPFVATQRHQREVVAVQVVVDHEVAGESGPGELRLIPGAVPALSFNQILDAPRDRLVFSLARRDQRHQRPGRL